MAAQQREYRSPDGTARAIVHASEWANVERKGWTPVDSANATPPAAPAETDEGTE